MTLYLMNSYKFLFKRNLVLLLIILLAVNFSQAQINSKKIPQAPLYMDPVFDGPADPTVFWNYEENNWWMVYTQRRANARTANLAWVHGTAIGVASSNDGGISWTYRGTLDLNYQSGHNTYWAPDVYYENGTYHFFVSFVQGVPTLHYDDPHDILLYTGKNMWELSFKQEIDLQSERVIDPTVVKLADNKYRIWFKHENAGYTTHYADSEDLLNWIPKGKAIDSTQCEGANVFYWQDRYWMITDPWYGIELYQSEKAEGWKKEGVILSGIGQRNEDTGKGHHACVVPAGEFAYIFYHCNPEERFGHNTSWDKIDYKQRRSVIQVARLRLENGKVICDRDEPFELELPKK